MKSKIRILALALIMLLSTVGALYANTDSDILAGTWSMPDESMIPGDAYGDMIRYGEELIINTPVYLGPDSSKPYAGSRISCSNCHREGGTKPYAIPLFVATEEYAPPGIYSAREGVNRTIQIRINGCFERSLSGTALPEDSYEMQSMVAYLKWLSTGIAPGLTWKDVKGQETPKLSLLDRASDPVRGQEIFMNRCAKCHGANGLGERKDAGYDFPPLWGSDSFNTGAGMNRGITATRLIKQNMPLGDATLSLEQAYDVVAFMNSNNRPVWSNEALDWSGYAPNGTPNINSKAADASYPPYFLGDRFSPGQHKYGAWQIIIDTKQ